MLTVKTKIRVVYAVRNSEEHVVEYRVRGFKRKGNGIKLYTHNNGNIYIPYRHAESIHMYENGKWIRL